jgi:uncharacterized protein YdiU (UPF0061 family)
MAGWNLARFAESLLPLLHEEQEKAIELAQEAIGEFNNLYHIHWFAGMRAKLGIFNEEEQDESLIEDLLNMMHKYKADYTNTFSALTFNRLDDSDLFRSTEFAEWKEKWLTRLAKQDESKSDYQQLMQSSNPAVIPRNHRVEEALEAAVNNGDFSVMNRLLEVLSNPYAHSQKQTDFCTVPVDSSQPYKTYCGT